MAAARERSTVCLVGDVPVESPRAPLFAKELRLVVSRSYGPGRYDPSYEERGIDYPAGYVRWTEGRNLEEVLRLMATGSLRPGRLTSHTFDIDEGPAAYELLESGEPSLGIVLRYPERQDRFVRDIALPAARRSRRRALGRRRPRVGVIGAGTFARTVLLPRLARRASIDAVVTATGPSAKATAQRYGARRAGTDPSLVFDDPDLDAVVIATRHDSHADYAVRALEAGKHVFVEKPLALDDAELAAVEAAARSSTGTLSVGFNRRFAPLAVRLHAGFDARGPLLVHYRVSAGRLPRGHWLRDPAAGGGRIVGEVCHFVDFAAFLCGGPPVHTSALAVEASSEPREDSVAATLAFAGGSVATIHYTALGDPSMAKERVEVLGEPGAAILEDFRELTVFRGGASTVTRHRRDKGHDAELEAFVRSCQTGVPAQELDELIAVMRSTFAIRDAVHGTQASTA